MAPHSTLGAVRIIRPRLVSHDPDEDTEFFYTVKDGTQDSLDKISFLSYGTPMYWWVLAERNDSIRDPLLDISDGDVIAVPDFQTALGYL
jgi:hypothetical protein